ncbi:Two-component system sensor histidine kinase/response regulator hybrid [uncultured Synechococcales cyanobacterium]|uniref:Circadian input-output histidine kinase CikA n=1 Tax=uncultured Synechococcales cyanobacterium TaxID=1936017 RepID=A0A6J4VMA4_9CYAN|nr:Two-component system sensor histidine kinase/response regulator hybrid [uncultured Synechococcales cyanobacterium]
MQILKASQTRNYAIAVLAVGVVVGVKLLLFPLIGIGTPFLLFIAAVMGSAWYAGVGSGLLATGLATLAGVFFFIPPLFSLAVGLNGLIQGSTFVLEGLFISLLCGTVRTAKKRAEVNMVQAQRHLQALHRSEARFGALAQSKLIGIIFSDLNGKITDANDTFLQMVGYTRDDLCSDRIRWSEMTPPEYRFLDERAVKELRSSGVCMPFEKEYIRKDGSRIPILLGAALLEGSQQDCVCFVLDIAERKRLEAERKRAEAALGESEKRFRVMADTAPVMIWTSGPDKLCNYFNKPWLDFTGRTLEQELGNGWAEGIHPDDFQRCLDTYVTAFDAHQDFRMDYRLRRFDGEYRWVLDIGAPRFTADGSFVGYIGSCVDITERKQVESEREQLLEREQVARAASEAARYAAEAASRIKDEFLATLSHELRTPLNAMVGWTQLLRTRKFNEATTARALETIDRNTKSLAQLIEDLLDVSRIVTGKLRLNARPVELIPVIEAAINTVLPAAEAKKIRIQRVCDPTAGPVSGDPDRLQQVVWNLLTNAVKFTPKGGRVQVRLERVSSHIEITVSDTGQGIKAEFLPHIFERFRQADSTITRSYGGLGLGLAIVRQLVELHGGNVHAQSPGDGQGATFMVSLPLMAVLETQDTWVHPAADSEELFDNLPSLKGLRILLVDDEADTRDLITIILEQCEAKVTAIASVREALVVIQQMQPDVLISDVGMPGEDGYTLIRKVRALQPEQGGRIPAVALTAYARMEDRTRALAAGFQMHVPKPVKPIELTTVVASLARRNEV